MDVRTRIRTIRVLKRIKAQSEFCNRAGIKDGSGYIAREGQTKNMEKERIRK